VFRQEHCSAQCRFSRHLNTAYVMNPITSNFVRQREQTWSKVQKNVKLTYLAWAQSNALINLIESKHFLNFSTFDWVRSSDHELKIITLPEHRFFLIQKPLGKPKKPTWIIFLTSNRQESTDRNSSTGKSCFSWQPADKKQFLTVVPDGLHLIGSRPTLVSAAVRSCHHENLTVRNLFVIPNIWNRQENLSSN
jgi:hypothetical protein